MGSAEIALWFTCLSALALGLFSSAEAADVEIRDASYLPATLVITEGDSVTWHNNETEEVIHTATSDDTISFDTGDIGMGEAATPANVTFLAPGVYNYTCRYHPAMRGSLSVEANAGEPLRANFTASVENMTVFVDASNSSGGIIAYVWTWGDGTNNGSQPIENHTYATYGNFTIALRIEDATGGNDTMEAMINVTAPAPPNVRPVATFDVAVNATKVAVDASGSFDPDGTLVAYAWEWGDHAENGTGRQANHTYASAGNYTIVLTVSDDGNLTGSAARYVVIGFSQTNTPPTASFVGSVTELVLTVDASSSLDDEGGVLEYSWDWDDGTDPGNGSAASHEYSSPGGYNVSLTVMDPQGASASTSTLFLIGRTNSEPVVQVDSPKGGDEVHGEFTVTGTATDADGDPLRISVSFATRPPVAADGFPTWSATLNASGLRPGDAVITVHATDAFSTSTIELTVTVIEPTVVGGGQEHDGDVDDLNATGPDVNVTDVVFELVAPGENATISAETMFITGRLVAPPGVYKVEARLDGFPLLETSTKPGYFSYELGTPVSRARHTLALSINGVAGSVIVVRNFAVAEPLVEHSAPAPSVPASSPTVQDTPEPAWWLLLAATTFAAVGLRRKL